MLSFLRSLAMLSFLRSIGNVIDILCVAFSNAVTKLSGQHPAWVAKTHPGLKQNFSEGLYTEIASNS